MECLGTDGWTWNTTRYITHNYATFNTKYLVELDVYGFKMRASCRIDTVGKTVIFTGHELAEWNNPVMFLTIEHLLFDNLLRYFDNAHLIQMELADY